MPPRDVPPGYKSHLENCFKKISDDPYIKKNCPEIFKTALSVYSKLKEYEEDYWAFSIDPPWEIQVGNDRDFFNRSASLFMGGVVIVKDSKFTLYTLSISIVLNPYLPNSEVVRRFHFDIHTGKGEGEKPICHMHYAGDARELIPYGFRYSLEPWLRKPRFPFPPFDIALLFDFLLRQFGTERDFGRKFVEDPHWRSLVKKSEILLLKKYCDCLHEHFATKPDEILYQKLCDSSGDWI